MSARYMKASGQKTKQAEAEVTSKTDRLMMRLEVAPELKTYSSVRFELDGSASPSIGLIIVTLTKDNGLERKREIDSL